MRFAVVLVALVLTCCTHYPPSTPIRVWESPACVVVLGPPPSPPQSFRDLSERCRTDDGERMQPGEPCLTTSETDDLIRFTAQAMAYASSAYFACRVSEPGVTDDVRTLDE